MTDPEFEATHGLLHRLERRWLPLISPDPGSFAYDPLPLAQFLPGIRVAVAAARGRRFTDAGCGIGTKLALMLGLGFAVHGIDCHQDYLDAASDLVPEATLEHADLLTVAEFDTDVLYMYRPYVDEDVQARAERHLVERCSPGTVLFFPGRPLALGLRQLAPEVWVK